MNEDFNSFLRGRFSGFLFAAGVVATGYCLSMISKPFQDLKSGIDSQTTNSNYSIVSKYHPSMSSGSDGAGFAEGYARMQIAKHSETGLVQIISGGKK